MDDFSALPATFGLSNHDSAPDDDDDDDDDDGGVGEGVAAAPSLEAEGELSTPPQQDFLSAISHPEMFHRENSSSNMSTPPHCGPDQPRIQT